MEKFVWACDMEKPSAINSASFCARNSEGEHRLNDIRSASIMHAENMALRRRIRAALHQHHAELLALPGNWQIRVDRNRNQLVLTSREYAYGTCRMHIVEF